ncbi:DUF2785 domain-containing protein [Weissella viridescens]|uniref:DUF2785 domain-containing protein n=1 Tax=Weissella viridescens TaxID=1629 RepID=A0A3P2RDV6_WEIVI|nr:DUF2785 domain-containing protein [Weissella viridescens]RRG18853.1 DUF2785 domain-containing protein [Weissella viridescens]
MSSKLINQVQRELHLMREEMQAGELYESLGLRVGELLDDLGDKDPATPVAQLDDYEVELIVETGTRLQRGLLSNKLQSVTDEDLATLINGLGQTDPEIREDMSLNVLLQLIQNQILTTEQLLTLNAHVFRPEVLYFHLLEQDNDGVFLRSFNLCLVSIMKLWEHPLPYTKIDYDRMLDLLGTYIALETDTRGFVDQKGNIRAFLHIGHVLDAFNFDEQLIRLDKIFLLTILMERYKRLRTPLLMGEEQRIAAYLVNLMAFDQLYIDYVLSTLKQMRQEMMVLGEPKNEGDWHRINNQHRLIDALMLNEKTPASITNYLKDLKFF